MTTTYDFTRELNFTETYCQYRDEHPAIREAMCLKAQYPGFLGPLDDEELFAGRLDRPLVGFSPDEWGNTAFGYYCLTPAVESALESGEYDADYRRRVREMLDFWRTENTSAKLRAAYPSEMAALLPSDNWMDESGIAFPLYRLTGGTVDFGKLIRLGIPGLRKEISRHAAAPSDGDPWLYEAMGISLDVLEDVCRWYQGQALSAASVTDDQGKRSDLLETAAVLDRIAGAPPEHFQEALQLFWLYSLVADVRNYGRMDVYMGDLLAADLDSGVITEAKALRLLQSMWRLMDMRHTIVHNRVIIGGLGRPNEAEADRFGMLAMEASRTVIAIEPQLSLRFYEGQDPALMAKALDVIGEGRTFPILYNDDVNIHAVERAFGFDRATAEQYVPYGCGEYIIEHQSFGTPSAVINLLKALEVTLHNGIDPVTGRKMGLALGEFSDFASFDDLLQAYRMQVEHYVQTLAAHEALEYRVAGHEAAYLYMSMLYDDCIERGEAIFSGGIRYLGGTLETYGNANTADSLTAIKELVYDRKLMTHAELSSALDANFDGHERQRYLMLNAPKYGNDHASADQMLLDVHNHVCRYVKEQKDHAGLHSYLVVIINNSANTLMGRSTAASADGRKAGESMNNGNTPSSGSDRNGLTAFLNSIVKPSPCIHAGAVQNMKFSRELFSARRSKLEALLATYFANGGAQAMITVVSRGDLERALIEPEKYSHVFVRVGGFSARFVELPRDVQLEILNRTIY